MNEDQTRPVTPDPPPPPGVPDIDVTGRAQAPAGEGADEGAAESAEEGREDPDQDVAEQAASPEPPD